MKKTKTATDRQEQLLAAQTKLASVDVNQSVRLPYHPPREDNGIISPVAAREDGREACKRQFRAYRVAQGEHDAREMLAGRNLSAPQAITAEAATRDAIAAYKADRYILLEKDKTQFADGFNESLIEELRNPFGTGYLMGYIRTLQQSPAHKQAVRQGILHAEVVFSGKTLFSFSTKPENRTMFYLGFLIGIVICNHLAQLQERLGNPSEVEDALIREYQPQTPQHFLLDGYKSGMKWRSQTPSYSTGGGGGGAGGNWQPLDAKP